MLANICWPFVLCQACSTGSTFKNPVTLCSKPVRQVLLLSLCYRWGNWGTENISNMSKVTKPINQHAVWLLLTSKAQYEAPGSCDSRTQGTKVQAQPRAAWRTIRVNLFHLPTWLGHSAQKLGQTLFWCFCKGVLGCDLYLKQCTLSKADCPPQCRWASSNQLKPKKNKTVSLPQVKENYFAWWPLKWKIYSSGLTLFQIGRRFLLIPQQPSGHQIATSYQLFLVLQQPVPSGLKVGQWLCRFWTCHPPEPHLCLSLSLTLWMDGWLDRQTSQTQVQM